MSLHRIEVKQNGEWRGLSMGIDGPELEDIRLADKKRVCLDCEETAEGFGDISEADSDYEARIEYRDK